MLKVDTDPGVSLLMTADPLRLLKGATPRLIDEWQAQPLLWNYIRHEIDDRKKTAQFILTGSANPVESIKMHSGAGRYTIVDMRTMSWQELGISTGAISLSDLFEGKKIDVYDQPTDLDEIIEKIIIGGFPGLIGKSVNQALDINRAYVELLEEIDMSQVSDIKRDPIKVRRLLKSISRNTTTMADISKLERDIKQWENDGLTRPTIYDYLDSILQDICLNPWSHMIYGSMHKGMMQKYTTITTPVSSKSTVSFRNKMVIGVHSKLSWEQAILTKRLPSCIHFNPESTQSM